MLYQLTGSSGIIVSSRSALKPPCVELVERAERIVEDLRLCIESQSTNECQISARIQIVTVVNSCGPKTKLTIYFHTLLLTAQEIFVKPQQLSHMSDSSLSQKSSLESLRSLSPVLSIQSEPDALPPSVEGRMVWQGNELEPNQYITNLKRTEVEAVRAAVVFFKCKNLLA